MYSFSSYKQDKQTQSSFYHVFESWIVFAIVSHVDLKNNLAMEFIATFLWFLFLIFFLYYHYGFSYYKEALG